MASGTVVGVRRLAVILAGLALAAGAAMALGGEVAPAPAPVPAVEFVPRAKLVKAVRARERAERRAERLLVALRAARSRPEYVWWSTHDTRKVAEAVFDEQGTPEAERVRWRCIFRRESNFLPDVWYGGARGWHPEYAGTDRVNGIAQLRPYHADLADDSVVSYATYLRTSDPVFSVRKALRLGFGPFFSSTGVC